MIEEELEVRLDALAGDKDGDAMEQFLAWLNAYFPVALKAEELAGQEPEAQQALILERIQEAYQKREEFESTEALVGLERYIVIRSLDRRWQDHLTEMEELRRSVNLRSYGQKDPLSEYKSEAYVFFRRVDDECPHRDLQCRVPHRDQSRRFPEYARPHVANCASRRPWHRAAATRGTRWSSCASTAYASDRTA